MASAENTSGTNLVDEGPRDYLFDVDEYSSKLPELSQGEVAERIQTDPTLTAFEKAVIIGTLSVNELNRFNDLNERITNSEGEPIMLIRSAPDGDSAWRAAGCIGTIRGSLVGKVIGNISTSLQIELSEPVIAWSMSGVRKVDPRTETLYNLQAYPVFEKQDDKIFSRWIQATYDQMLIGHGDVMTQNAYLSAREQKARAIEAYYYRQQVRRLVSNAE